MATANAMIASRTISLPIVRHGKADADSGRDRSNQRVQIAAGSTGAVRSTIRSTGLGLMNDSIT